MNSLKSWQTQHTFLIAHSQLTVRWLEESSSQETYSAIWFRLQISNLLLENMLWNSLSLPTLNEVGKPPSYKCSSTHPYADVVVVFKIFQFRHDFIKFRKRTIYSIFSTVLQDLENAHLHRSYCILPSALKCAHKLCIKGWITLTWAMCSSALFPMLHSTSGVKN